MLTEPYKIIHQLPRDFDMKQRRRRPLLRQSAKSSHHQMSDKARRSEIDFYALNAQRIDADPELTKNKPIRWFIAWLIFAILIGIFTAWS